VDPYDGRAYNFSWDEFENDIMADQISGLVGEKKAIVHVLAQRASLPDPGAIYEALDQVAARMAEVETARSGFHHETRRT
jgi:hypothetical protein